MLSTYLNKYHLTKDQISLFIKVGSQIDLDKATYLQKVDLTDEEWSMISNCRQVGVSRETSEIQVSQRFADVARDCMAWDYYRVHREPITEMGIDIETFSDMSIENGVYKYVDTPNFEILLFCVSINGGAVLCFDLARGERLPVEIIEALYDDDVLKTAFNANFERTCLSNHLRTHLSERAWDCTMVRALRLTLPPSLSACGTVLGLPQQKLKEGKDLIRLFSIPCKPTKSNGGRTRNLPEHFPDKWETFKRYCIRDVVVEQEIRRRVLCMPVSQTEKEAWWLDQRINDRGVLLNLDMARNAVKFSEEYSARLKKEAQEITGLENPNSPVQLKKWLKEETGIDFPTLDKNTVAEYKDKINSAKARRVLQIRSELGKTSVAKYQKALDCACSDGRGRGFFQFGGASRSLRFAGRLLQLQNLSKNHIDDLDDCRNLLLAGDLDDFEMMYGNVPDMLSQLVRTMLIAKPGCTFHVCDFSAIECRVLAWVAGEEWVLDVFRNNGDIYCATASQMLGIPVEKHGVNGEYRQHGKVANLACIAEGELILTDKGLVPIEQVTTTHKVWDGENWVAHEGVIFKGYKDIIEYDGLKATYDHIVYIRENGQIKQVQFGDASACGAYLVQSGNGGQAIRVVEDNICREKIHTRLVRMLCACGVSGLWSNPMDALRKPYTRFIKRLSVLHSDKKAHSATVVDKEMRSTKNEMREPSGQEFSKLWCARYKVLLFFCKGVRRISRNLVWRSAQDLGHRPSEQCGKLREGQSQVCNAKREPRQPEKYASQSIFSRVLGLFGTNGTPEIIGRVNPGRNKCASMGGGMPQTQGVATNSGKVRVYDILNAGQHHRYTASGKLVHNCGYGGGVGAFIAFGGDRLGMTEETMKETVDKWRSANPRIVRFWKHMEQAFRTAISGVRPMPIERGIQVEPKWGGVRVKLPSGRYMFYVGAHVNSAGRICYWGMNQTTRKWEVVETFGGKLVENCIQAIARDILIEKMLRLDEDGLEVVAHIHDEVIVEARPDQTLSQIEEIFSEEVDWAKGLPLNGAGYTTPYYLKD